MPEATALKEYVTAANKLLSAYGKSFHWARYFLGKEAGLQATQLYAFCRYLDDIADQPDNLGATKLKSIQNIFNNYSYQTGSYPEVDNFLLLKQELDLPVFAVKDLLKGLISDQGTVLLLNENQLIQYSYKVAGTVGLMMAPILGISSKKAIPFAVDLGIAMQLTNISRDVLEDAELGRRYIPGEWCDDLSAPKIVELAKNGTTEDRLKVSAAIKRTLLLAETYYVSGFKGLAYLPPRNHLAILIAGIIYRLIGRRLLKNGTEWWVGRQVVNSTGKLLHSLYPPLLMLNRFKRLPVHDSHLHKCLKDYIRF